MKTKTKLLAIMVVAAFLVMMSPTVTAWPHSDYDKLGLFGAQPAIEVENGAFSSLGPNINQSTQMAYLLGGLWLPYNLTSQAASVNGLYRVSLKITYPNGWSFTMNNMSTSTSQTAWATSYNGTQYWASTFWKDIRNYSLTFNQTGMYRFNYYVDCVEWTYVWWFGWWLPLGSHMVQLGASNWYYNITAIVHPILPITITGPGMWWIGAVTGSMLIFLPVLMAFGWRRSDGVGKIKLIVIGGVTMLLLYVMTMVFLPLG